MKTNDAKVLDFVGDIVAKAKVAFLKRDELFTLYSIYSKHHSIIRPSFPSLVVKSLPYKPSPGSFYIVDTSLADENSPPIFGPGEIIGGIRKEPKGGLRPLLFDGYVDCVNTRQNSLRGKRPSTQVMKSMIFGIADIRVTYFNLEADERKTNWPTGKARAPEGAHEEFLLEGMLSRPKLPEFEIDENEPNWNFRKNVGPFGSGFELPSQIFHGSSSPNHDPFEHQNTFNSESRELTRSLDKIFLLNDNQWSRSITGREQSGLQKRVYTCPTFPSVAIVLYNSAAKPKKNGQISKKISKGKPSHEALLSLAQQIQTHEKHSPINQLPNTINEGDGTKSSRLSEQADYFARLRVKALAPSSCSIKGGEMMILALNKKLRGPIYSIEVNFGGLKASAKMLNCFAVQCRVPTSENSNLVKPFITVNKEFTVQNKRCNFSYLTDPFEEFNKDIKNILDLDESETNNDVRSLSHDSKNDSMHESQDDLSLNEKPTKAIPMTGNPQPPEPKFLEMFQMKADDEIIKQDHCLEEERIQEDLETLWGLKDVVDMGSFLNLDQFNSQERTFNENARIIQKNIRGWISRRRYCMLKSAVIKLQKRFKMTRRDK
jgi:hypothetical protein